MFQNYMEALFVRSSKGIFNEVCFQQPKYLSTDDP